MPKPIQIALAYDPDAEHVHRMALCSDGSLWAWGHDGTAWAWLRMPDIPEQQATHTDDVWR